MYLTAPKGNGGRMKGSPATNNTRDDDGELTRASKTKRISFLIINEGRGAGNWKSMAQLGS
jgi:hypothetical protein